VILLKGENPVHDDIVINVQIRNIDDLRAIFAMIRGEDGAVQQAVVRLNEAATTLDQAVESAA